MNFNIAGSFTLRSFGKEGFYIKRLLLLTGSGWQQDDSMIPSRGVGKYPERQFGNAAAIEHGKKLRHQSKNPEYFKTVGVTNGIKGNIR